MSESLKQVEQDTDMPWYAKMGWNQISVDTGLYTSEQATQEAEKAEGDAAGYKEKTENKIKDEKYKNTSELVGLYKEGSTQTTPGSTGKLDPDDGTSKTPSGSNSGSPSSSTKPQRDALKMQQEADFYKLKIASDSYASSLDRLKTLEDIYGKTVASSNEELDLKHKRSTELAKQADEYTHKT